MKDFNGNRRFRSNRFDDKPKPVNVGEEYDVEIESVGEKGDGIAKINNFVTFVPGVQKGDKVRIKIKSVGRRFAFAEKVE